MKRSGIRPGLLSVLLPSGIVMAGAWMLARYLDSRGAPAAGVHGARTERARGRWDWPTAGPGDQSNEAASQQTAAASRAGQIGA